MRAAVAQTKSAPMDIKIILGKLNAANNWAIQCAEGVSKIQEHFKAAQEKAVKAEQNLSELQEQYDAAQAAQGYDKAVWKVPLYSQFENVFIF